MRTIIKGREPTSLVEHRTATHATYENYAGKQTLRELLVAEQRGLCCYCLSRIRPESARMKIAHWRPQTSHPDQQLDYGNLLGACLGNEGQPLRDQHCDTAQRDRDVSRNPANPVHRVGDVIHYRADGTITSDDAQFDREMNEVLNLNVAFLKNNRKAALDAFKLAIKKGGTFERPTLERWIAKWHGDSDVDPLPPFCQVIVYWLKKRLARI